MNKTLFWILSSVSLSVLSACSFKGPFEHSNQNPQALTIANLPTVRMAVPVPSPVKISNRLTSERLTRALTSALVAQNVPAVSRPPVQGDWWLDLESRFKDNNVIVHYSIINNGNLVQSQGDSDPIDKKAWNEGNRDALNTIALQIAPEVAHILTDIRSERMMHDPLGLNKRTARIYFNGVEGAPGDGNLLLARAFYAAYPKGAGILLTNDHGADFHIHTEVNLMEAPPDPQGMPQQQIEIIWRVQSLADKKEIGAATQIHTIPAHSLDGHWGDTAGAAANEAASAIAQIISNYTGKSHKPLRPPESKILSEPTAHPDPMEIPAEKNY